MNDVSRVIIALIVEYNRLSVESGAEGRTKLRTPCDRFSPGVREEGAQLYWR